MRPSSARPLRALTTLREELKAAVDADAEAYNLVMKAYKAAKESAMAALP